jgi:hypothetical protein
VKRLVEIHGGEVHVRSVFGRGSTFSIVLPLAAPEEAQAQEGPHPRDRLEPGALELQPSQD